MKILKFTAIALIATLVIACGSKGGDATTTEEVVLESLNHDNLLVEIEKREKALSQDSVKTDRQKAEDLLEAYMVFQERFSNDDKSAEYLFKAGEIAMGINLTAISIKCLDKVYNDYKSYEKRPYALFLKAFVQENQANNYEEAKANYELFIQEYPEHEMTDDAEYSIKNMGKTPEELIREFEIQDSIRAANAEA